MIVEEKMKGIAEKAVSYFNKQLNMNYSFEDRLRLIPLLPEDRDKQFEKICKKYAPHRLQEDYTSENYFTDVNAEVLYGDEVFVILYLPEKELDDDEWFHVMLHELSHIFCYQNEFKGKDFFNLYCKNEDVEGRENYIIGYAIWREFIAELIARSIHPMDIPYSLGMVKDYIWDLQDDIGVGIEDSKYTFSRLLVSVFMSKQFGSYSEWDKIERSLRRSKLFSDGTYYMLLKRIFEKIKNQHEKIWEIDETMIFDIGNLYSQIIVNKYIND